MASITQLPDKRWRAVVRRKGFPVRSKIFEKKLEAQQWSGAIESQLTQGADGYYTNPQANTTVGKLIRTYVNEMPSIGRSKLAYLKVFEGYYEQTPLRKFSQIHLQAYIDKRVKDKVSGVTMAGEVSALSSVLKWGKSVKRLKIDTNMAKDVRTSLSQNRNINTRSMEREREISEVELNLLLDDFSKKPIVKTHMVPVIKFALATTMRLGEIVSLQIEDLDLHNKTILVKNRKHPTKQLGNDQTVPLINGAYEIALQMMGDRKEGQLFNLHTEDAIGANFQRACKRLMIKDLHFHDLRHSGISALFRQGLPIQYVAVLSGHQDWKMLKRYTHIKASDVHKLLKDLDHGK